MLALRLTFPWGRYYAHPWGLNPARLREAEWPPSPWRLLRALAAGWFRAHGGQTPTPELLALLESLGRELPEIAVGPVAFSQSIHWQPNLGDADKEKRAAASYKRTRHESHFAATESPVVFCWKTLALEERLRPVLADILPHVSYFGRAESLCRIELGEGDDLGGLGSCWPLLDNGIPIRRIAEDCRDVFSPDPRSFQPADLWSRHAGRHEVDPDHAPPHLVEDLLGHQPLPDGGRWVSYQMPDGWPGEWVVRVAKSIRRKAVVSSEAPRVARYLRFSLQCRVPIPLRFTVLLAERFRQQALRFFGQVKRGGSSFALSGHDRPTDVESEHQHAFYLPLGVDPAHPDLLTELHVWCSHGLTQSELEALMWIQRLDWGSGRYPIRPVLLAVGNAVPDGCPIAVGQFSSRIWRSRTPFVPPRYFYRGAAQRAKLKVRDAPEQQLAECLRLSGIASPGEIRRLSTNGRAQRSIPPTADWDIVRVPKGGTNALTGGVATAVHVPSEPGKTEETRRVGMFFEIVFDSPVRLSVPALGHSAHFGLGQFTPSSG